MVKNIKYIFTRILIGVGVVIALQLLQGTLIGDVYAEVWSSYRDNNENFANCTNCSSITYNWHRQSDFLKNKTGSLIFSVMNYSESDSNSFIPTITLARVTIDSYPYICEISSHSNGYYVTQNGLNRYVNQNTISCPVTFKTGGVIDSIYIQTNGSGTGGISIYSPISFVTSDSQEIITSITENSQNEIESQKVCTNIDKSYGKIFGSALSNNGSIVTSGTSSWVITKYFNVKGASLKKLSTFGTNFASCWYDEDKNLISCFKNGDTPLGDISIPTNANYVRFSISTNENKPTYELCQNGNQSVVDSTNELNDTLNDNNISDSTNSSINSTLGSKTQQETFGPVADLLLLPLTLFGAFYSGFNGTCATFDLGTLFNTNLTLPCINLQSILGSSLYNTIDVAISLFMIFNIVMMCIDIFDRITSFEDPFNELYTPKHTYQPKHGGGR